MWQEYTRETPARPLLAPLGTGLALAATLALAWVVRPAAAGPSVSGLQSPPRWPVAFTLPNGFTWAEQTDGEESLDGLSGNLVYDGLSSDLLPSVLGVSFAVLPEAADAQQAAVELLGHEISNPRPVKIGPLQGLMAESRDSSGVRFLSAAAVSESGLAVSIHYVSPRITTRERSAFQVVCQSIQYRKWWTGKPNDGLLPLYQKK
jgi:hypothetical protein